MYRLLVPVDDNEERAEKQIETIESFPAVEGEIEVHVLYVYEEIDIPADEAGPASIEDINESLDELRDVPDSVDRVIEAVEGWGIDPILHELVDDPATAILSASRELDADAVLMGVRDRTPIGKVVLGSVSQKVILGSDIPVIVAR